MGIFRHIEWDIAPGGFFLWALGLLILPVPLFFGALVAIAVHELAHLAALWAFKVRILGVCVKVTGIRIHTQHMEGARELLCAAAGPMGSFLLICISELWPQLAVCGFIQGFFNLLPLGNSDGARILRCILEWINPEWAAFLPKWCGYIILLICIGLGVLIMIRLPGTTGPVFVALAMVLGRVLENPLAKTAFRGYNKHNYVLRGKRYD